MYGIGIVWMFVLLKFIWEYKVVATARSTSVGSKFEQVCVVMDDILKEQNATNVCYTVNLVAKSQSRTKEEQKQLLNNIAELVETQEKFFGKTGISIEEETRSNGTSMCWTLNETNMSFMAQYLDMEEDYVVLTVKQTGSGDCKKAAFYMKHFYEFVAHYDLTGIPCMEVTAYLPKVLGFTEKNVLSENIFYMFQTKQVDGIRSSDLYTIYGYSNIIPISIHVAEQLMNINISFSTIEETSQTILQIGIPISNQN